LLRRQQVFLNDWDKKLDEFLRFNDRDVLEGSGSVTKKVADDTAKKTYEAFAIQRRLLKEAEGEKANIDALREIAKTRHNDTE
jgi:hypothetical protein